MAKTMPEQTGATKRDEREARPADVAGATQPSAAPRDPEDREPGELDEDALEKVSGGRIAAANY